MKFFPLFVHECICVPSIYLGREEAFQKVFSKYSRIDLETRSSYDRSLWRVFCWAKFHFDLYVVGGEYWKVDSPFFIRNTAIQTWRKHAIELTTRYHKKTDTHAFCKEIFHKCTLFPTLRALLLESIRICNPLQTKGSRENWWLNSKRYTKDW